jgi:hypothetical protein
MTTNPFHSFRVQPQSQCSSCNRQNIWGYLLACLLLVRYLFEPLHSRPYKRIDLLSGGMPCPPFRCQRIIPLIQKYRQSQLQTVIFYFLSTVFFGAPLSPSGSSPNKLGKRGWWGLESLQMPNRVGRFQSTRFPNKLRERGWWGLESLQMPNRVGRFQSTRSPNSLGELSEGLRGPLSWHRDLPKPAVATGRFHLFT